MEPKAPHICTPISKLSVFSTDVYVLQPALVIERQVIGWFKVEHEDPHVCTPTGKFPVFLLQDEEDFWYGFPQFGHQGLKIGKFDHAPPVVAADPDNVSRQVTKQDEQVLHLSDSN